MTSKTHTGLYKCPKCGKLYTFKQKLDRHIKIDHNHKLTDY